MKNYIEQKAKELNLSIECYEPSGYGEHAISLVSAMYTDNCRYIDDSIPDDCEILDYGVLSPDDYNCSINANNGEKQDVTVMVVLVKMND
jgi:hypothetical protein